MAPPRRHFPSARHRRLQRHASLPSRIKACRTLPRNPPRLSRNEPRDQAHRSSHRGIAQPAWHHARTSLRRRERTRERMRAGALRAAGESDQSALRYSRYRRRLARAPNRRKACRGHLECLDPHARASRVGGNRPGRTPEQSQRVRLRYPGLPRRAARATFELARIAPPPR